MPSTTSTNLRFAVAVAIGLTGGAATADPVPMGCYVRHYDAAHLAKSPDQIVESVRLWVHPSPRGDVWANLSVTFTDQGRIADTVSAEQTLDQFLVCWSANGARGCSVECDGGWFDVVGETDATLTLQTEYLLVGQRALCGGTEDMFEDMAEVRGQPVRYRLNKSSPNLCGDMQ